MRLAIILLIAQISNAETIYVTAEKIDRPIESSTNKVEVIGTETIRQSSSKYLGEFLQSRAGIYITSNGDFAGVSSLKMRGTQRGYTKIIIDGMEINDPTDINNSVQLNNISLSHIESIEILKGSQSTLYGSDSIGGVIKINTMSSAKNEGELIFSAGSHNSKATSIYYSGKKTQKLKYKINADYSQTDGISAYNARRTQNAEKDSAKKINLNTVLETNYLETNIRYQFHYLNSKTDFDDFGADRINDDLSKNTKASHLIDLTKRSNNDLIKHNLSFKYVDISRDFQGSYPTNIDGGEKKISYKLNYYHSENYNSLFGIDHERQDSRDKFDFTKFESHKIENTSAYTAHNFKLNDTIIDLSLRNDHHSLYKNVHTYKVGISNKITPLLRLSSNFATGFKSPTLYEIYGGKSNVNLEPTKSKYADILIDSNFTFIDLSTSLFHYDFKNQISYENDRYFNISKSDITGLEIELSKDINNYNITNSLTLQNAKDSTGKNLSRTPKSLFKSNITIRGRLNYNIEYIYVGNRDDSGRMPSYSLINSVITYKDFKLSLKNLLNKNYEDTRTYGTSGRSFYLEYAMSF